MNNRTPEEHLHPHDKVIVKKVYPCDWKYFGSKERPFDHSIYFYCSREGLLIFEKDGELIGHYCSEHYASMQVFVSDPLAWGIYLYGEKQHAICKEIKYLDPNL